MTRRLVNVTLDNLDDLPVKCRRCVFWELDPVARSRAEEMGDTALEKEAWVSQALLEWGSCGKVAYVDGVAAGYVLFAPPSATLVTKHAPAAPTTALVLDVIAENGGTPATPPIERAPATTSATTNERRSE